MPNPRLTVRIPPDVEELLPDDSNERSRITIEALRAYLQPTEESAELSNLKRRVEALERQSAR